MYERISNCVVSLWLLSSISLVPYEYLMDPCDLRLRILAQGRENVKRDEKKIYIRTPNLVEIIT